MKIIFSRKGFDSSAGGFASPVFPDGRLYSVPIPGDGDKYGYPDLSYHWQGEPIQQVMNDLTGRRIVAGKKQPLDYKRRRLTCHHDPLWMDDAAFRGIALGQAGSAEGHLRGQSVGPGDIFLYYGWFRAVEKRRGKWVYGKDAPDLHVIWAAMTVGEKHDIDSPARQKALLGTHPFLGAHPHIGRDWSRNAIYLSRRAEYFDFADIRCLTDRRDYRGRASWRLPRCFQQPDAFTFLNNFEADGDEVLITYRGYGQEFVLDLDRLTEQEKAGCLDFVSRATGL